jgi:acyl-CoA reductase-like NAD-dependent aldehyde dehydrogenase
MSSGTTAIGGQVDEQDNYIAPTVLRDCKASDPAMKEEVRQLNRDMLCFS